MMKWFEIINSEEGISSTPSQKSTSKEFTQCQDDCIVKEKGLEGGDAINQV